MNPAGGSHLSDASNALDDAAAAGGILGIETTSFQANWAYGVRGNATSLPQARGEPPPGAKYGYYIDQECRRARRSAGI
jgi:hypothetical protein